MEPEPESEPDRCDCDPKARFVSFVRERVVHLTTAQSIMLVRSALVVRLSEPEIAPFWLVLPHKGRSGRLLSAACSDLLYACPQFMGSIGAESLPTVCPDFRSKPSENLSRFSGGFDPCEVPGAQVDLLYLDDGIYTGAHLISVIDDVTYHKPARFSVCVIVAAASHTGIDSIREWFFRVSKHEGTDVSLSFRMPVRAYSLRELAIEFGLSLESAESLAAENQTSLKAVALSFEHRIPSRHSSLACLFRA
ncbi:MAG: hypothetical protein ACYCOU_20790 [Sulfobacillus sp.]